MASWLQTLLMGTHASLAMDLEDLDHDVSRVRNRLRGQEQTDDTQFRALLILRQELTETRLVVAELIRLLLESGALDRAALARFIEQLEKPGKTIDRARPHDPER